MNKVNFKSESTENVLVKLGRKIRNNVKERLIRIGLFFGLFYTAFHVITVSGRNQRRIFLDSLLRQIYFTGVQAITPIVIIAFVMGGAVIIQTINQLPKVGAESMIGSVLVVVIVREFGPLLISFILIGRSATAITTEIAEMRVSGEFQNLLTIGVNPAFYLFAPRIWGMILSLFVLKTFFIASALFGGFLMARAATYVNFRFLLKGFFTNLTLSDISGMFIRSFFIGAIIAIIAIREALKVKGSSTEIPQATSRTVLTAVFYVLIVDISFAALGFIIL
jgi:phospholipid/cholesterol/gamma-HCH transport system permease protein